MMKKVKKVLASMLLAAMIISTFPVAGLAQIYTLDSTDIPTVIQPEYSLDTDLPTTTPPPDVRDLEVTGIRWSSDEKQIIAEVCNNGTVTEDSFSIRFNANGKKNDLSYSSGLLPGTCMDIYSWDAASAFSLRESNGYNITATVDYLNSIEESNESNNEYGEYLVFKGDVLVLPPSPSPYVVQPSPELVLPSSPSPYVVQPSPELVLPPSPSPYVVQPSPELTLPPSPSPNMVLRTDDLLVKSLRWDTNQDYLIAEVCNNGYYDQQGWGIKFNINNKDGVLTGPVLTSGSCMDLYSSHMSNFDLTENTKYTVSAYVDHRNLISESNESNNLLYTELTYKADAGISLYTPEPTVYALPSPSPELFVTPAPTLYPVATPYPETPKVDLVIKGVEMEQFYDECNYDAFRVEMGNAGTEAYNLDSKGFALKIIVNGTELPTSYYARYHSGNSSTKTLYAYNDGPQFYDRVFVSQLQPALQKGTNTIKVIIDAAGDVNESNENNNIFTKTIEIEDCTQDIPYPTCSATDTPLVAPTGEEDVVISADELNVGETVTNQFSVHGIRMGTTSSKSKMLAVYSPKSNKATINSIFNDGVNGETSAGEKAIIYFDQPAKSVTMLIHTDNSYGAHYYPVLQAYDSNGKAIGCTVGEDGYYENDQFIGIKAADIKRVELNYGNVLRGEEFSQLFVDFEEEVKTVDLTITEAYASSNRYNVGEVMEVKAVVKNIGNGTFMNGKLYVKADNITLDQPFFASSNVFSPDAALAPGESETFILKQVVLTPGKQTLRLNIEYPKWGYGMDSNHDNDTYSEDITFDVIDNVQQPAKKPDFEIPLGGVNYDKDDDVVMAEVCNDLNRVYTDVPVSFDINDRLMVTYVDLNPGCNTVRSWSLSNHFGITENGSSHGVTAMVDPYNQYDEIDENNNKVVADFVYEGSSDYVPTTPPVAPNQVTAKGIVKMDTEERYILIDLEGKLLVYLKDPNNLLESYLDKGVKISGSVRRDIRTLTVESVELIDITAGASLNNDLTVKYTLGATIYKDIDTGDRSIWYVPYLEPLYARGVFTGYVDGRIGAADSLSISQLAKVVVVSADLDISEVSNHHWAVKYMRVAQEMGLFDNVDYADSSQWDRTATREEAVKALIRAHGLSAATVKGSCFPDTEDPEICRAKELGIISGYPDGSFKPKNGLKRSEMAKIIMRAIKVRESIEVK